MIGTIAVSTGSLLVLVGLWSALTNRDIIRMIVGFTIFDVGIHLIMISVGYISGGTAPIISNLSDIGVSYVDPVPQALVLTAIVIGLGITAFMLTYAVNMYEKKGTLEIDKFEELKW
ncbi:MAG: NADH-quinone oxidoreductase subunit K [Spirochaetales bacterium]|nr:NADH-quinone oxidoreductase subunit K [Spirochaetales bacterium]